MATSQKQPAERKGLSREETNKALNLVKYLEKKPEAAEFLKPVDYKGMGLDDYPLIIKHPMDLSTVRKKLKSSKYNSFEEVVVDLNLVWDNCRTYNQIGSFIVQQADAMESHMKKYCAKHGISTEAPQKRPRDENEPQPSELISFESKVELAEKIRKASHEVLAEIVKIVEAQCKNAVEELDKERIQIKVDVLDKATFDKLTGLVNEEPSPTKRPKQ